MKTEMIEKNDLIAELDKDLNSLKNSKDTFSQSKKQAKNQAQQISQKNSSQKKKLFVIILGVLFFLILAISLFFKQKNLPQSTTSQKEEQINPTVKTHFTEPIYDEQKQELQVSLVLDSKLPSTPTAIDIEILHPPEVMEIASTEFAMWESNSIIKQETNKTQGITKIVAVQPFGSETNDSNILINLTFKTLQNTNNDIELSVLQKSALATLETPELQYFYQTSTNLQQ